MKIITPARRKGAARHPAPSARFVKALGYAARLHARQIRKGTNRPYIGHLLGVASIVIEYGGDEEMVIAALLHDAVEDHGGLPRLGEIRRKFGAPVAHEPADVRLVSAADKLSNARETLAGLRRHVMATALLPSSRAKKLAVCGTTALWLPYFAPQAAIRS